MPNIIIAALVVAFLAAVTLVVERRLDGRSSHASENVFAGRRLGFRAALRGARPYTL